MKASFPRRAFLQSLGAAVAVRALAKTSSEPNAQPDPYHVVMNWAHLPDGMKWGQAIAMDIDKNGDIYVFHRNDPGVLKFSPDGTYLKSWGTGIFVFAHGLLVDRFGYIWTADANVKDGRGGQVLKFDPDGKLVMELGKKGVRGESATGETFSAPTGVAVGANGDIFVSDGHDRDPKYGNHRILKFSKDGKFIKAWGSKTGSAQGEVSDPHGIAMDSHGRLLVADRGNKRVQVFDPEGNFVAEWPQFGSCENIYITKNDALYVTDSNSSEATKSPYKRGVRIGSAKDGSVRYFIPEESYDPGQKGTSGPVGLCADAKGTVYAADVGVTVGFDKMMKKYVKA
jgi:DNA-binding beta-propeller fold protein YncE